MNSFKKGAVTIMMGDCWSDGTCQFEELTVEGDPVVYRRQWRFRSAGEVDVRQYVYQRLRTQADAKLQEWVETHIQDMDFYTETDEYGCCFWNSVAKFTEEYPGTPTYYDTQFSFEKICDGVMIAIVNGYKCFLNFEDRTFQFEKKHGANCQKITALDVLYPPSIRTEILAIEQYKRGTAHPAFTELLNLSKALEKKDVVQIVLKNKRKFKITTEVLTAGDLVAFEWGKFVIKINPGKTLPIDLVNHLQIGKEKYAINTQNLHV
ncbi:hypothetical protein CEB3_c13470 [Peptococcaceae bacterium CEB3]|nr:hypothetical protein CEB3_c13470 [Peptococcaceae bacterium CEB3]